MLKQQGFMTAEIMIAFSLMTIFILSTYALSASMHEIKAWSLGELSRLRDAVRDADDLVRGGFANISGYDVGLFGSDTDIVSVDPFSMSYSDYDKAWGRNTCNPRLVFDENNVRSFPSNMSIGSGNASTDIEARNGIVYLTADSASSGQKDFFIIDARDPSSPLIASSLDTGPGASALEVAGPYVFLAQASSVNQLQVVDIHDRLSPHVVSQLRILTPTPTTTAPIATSIFYSSGFVYLGTAKWNGSELSIIDVSNPYNPFVVSSYETDTQISDIYVRNDRAYLATADEEQLEVLDVSDKAHPVSSTAFSPSGWQTQTGKSLEFFEGRIGFGRTVGGFNVAANHEAFIFSTGTDVFAEHASRDIPGGVYGMLIRPRHVFLLTHSSGHEFQIWDSELKEKTFEIPLNTAATKLACDGSTIFFATGDDKGITGIEL